MSTPLSPSRPTPRGVAIAILLLVVGAVILIVLDPVLAWDDANPYIGKGRLFLYFTAQSNAIAVAALIAYGVSVLRGRAPSRGVEYLRGLAVVDMAITGIVNGALLSEPGAGFDFSEFVLHQGGPIVVIAWWIAMPPAERLPFGAIGLWLIHPVLWTAMTLMYASESSDHWVPYFFLDPAAVDGVGGVAMFVVIIHVVIAVLGVGAVLATRLPWAGRVRSAVL